MISSASSIRPDREHGTGDARPPLRFRSEPFDIVEMRERGLIVDPRASTPANARWALLRPGVADCCAAEIAA
jgi:hypothetical protein